MIIFKYELGDVLTVVDDCLAGPVVFIGNDPRLKPHVWIQGEEEAERVRRSFAIVGTGHQIPFTAEIIHVGSWVSGPYVWHGYEVMKL